MDNYTKGKNIEEPVDKATLPIPNLPEDFVWIHVKGGTKMSNVLPVGLDAMKEGKPIVWSGSGPAVAKVISCAEIIKRNYKQTHQFNKIIYIKNIEEWEPKLEGLDKLIVKRDVPAMHILLSKDPINSNLPGYQCPECTKNTFNKTRRPQGKKPQQRKINPEEFANVGLRSANYKEKKQYRNEI